MEKICKDNCVFVDRNLVTYISKSRKKIIDYGSIKLTNGHDVSYKLVVDV